MVMGEYKSVCVLWYRTKGLYHTVYNNIYKNERNLKKHGNGMYIGRTWLAGDISKEDMPLVWLVKNVYD